MLTADDIVLKRMRIDDVPEGVATSEDEIIDLRTTRIITRDNFIQKAHLTDKNSGGVAIPEGYTVYSMTPNVEGTFYNTLRPGDLIDMIGILTHPTSRQKVSKRFLKSVRIYAVNDRMHDQTEERQQIKLVQVLLKPRQAEYLSLIEATGTVQFVKVPESQPGEEMEDDPLFDEENEEPVSLAHFFGEDRKKDQFDPEKNGALQMIQAVAAKAAEAAQPKYEKPFTQVIWTADGPKTFQFSGNGAPPVQTSVTAGSYRPAPTQSPDAAKEVDPTLDAEEVPKTIPPDNNTASSTPIDGTFTSAGANSTDYPER